MGEFADQFSLQELKHSGWIRDALGGGTLGTSIVGMQYNDSEGTSCRNGNVYAIITSINEILINIHTGIERRPQRSKAPQPGNAVCW